MAQVSVRDLHDAHGLSLPIAHLPG
jgi:hypothetical protein